MIEGEYMGLLNKMLGINEIKKPEFLKEFNIDENEPLQQLTNLLSLVTKDCKDKVEKEIWNVKSGLAGERNVYYELINSRLPILCLHDIRLEYNHYEAQFDFIVIASNFILVIETKRMFGNIHIDNEGNFTREYFVGNKMQKEGMYSPITQNERHIALLKEFLLDHKLILYCPIFSLVVIANDKTIVNKKDAKQDIKDLIIKHDQLIDKLEALVNTNTKVKMNSNKMQEIAQSIENENKPTQIDYVKKLGLTLLSKQKKLKESKQESNLYLELKEYRLKKSQELNVKPYMIFSNKELDLLVKTKPQTKKALIDLPGFAEKKYELYGEAIMSIIKNNL
jgi:hypothetical protein